MGCRSSRKQKFIFLANTYSDKNMSDQFHLAVGTGQKSLDRLGRIVYSRISGLKTRKASGQAVECVPYEQRWRVGPMPTGHTIQIGSEASPRHDSRTGGLAQLGERRVRNAEVEGSNPLPSTRIVSFPGIDGLAQDRTLLSAR